MRMTPDNLVRLIAELPRDREYAYANPQNHGRIIILDVKLPLGPVTFKRYNPSEGKSAANAKPETISGAGLLRVANAITEETPVNLDRVLAGSYNFRSVLEALLAASPQFYVCKPGRIELEESRSQIKPGHKHLLWRPSSPHPLGTVFHANTNKIVSEIPSTSATFESLVLPSTLEGNLNADIQRTHSLIQVSLVVIAERLGMMPFVAKNDQAIEYEGTKLGERSTVLPDLRRVQWLQSYGEAIRTGSLIDCIWFRNGRFMPAVIEVEHSTGVTSGLSRMRTFADSAPKVETRYVVAAPDEDRAKVLSEFNKTQFKALHPAFMPYSAVRELLGLVQRRDLHGAVNDGFLEAFLERAA
jgi:type II restriction enzyme